MSSQRSKIYQEMDEKWESGASHAPEILVNISKYNRESGQNIE
jgi:hypothetical protein